MASEHFGWFWFDGAPLRNVTLFRFFGVKLGTLGRESLVGRRADALSSEVGGGGPWFTR